MNVKGPAHLPTTPPRGLGEGGGEGGGVLGSKQVKEGTLRNEVGGGGDLDPKHWPKGLERGHLVQKSRGCT